MPFSGYQDLNPQFATALQNYVAAVGGVEPFSGYRSPERQAQLYSGALEKYGSPEAARKWVAPPGHSEHNFGNAVDLHFADDAARQRAHALAGQYGLTFPLANEPWHIEPIGARAATVGGGQPGFVGVDMNRPAGTLGQMSGGGQGFDIFGGRVPASGLYDVPVGGNDQAQPPMTAERFLTGMLFNDGAPLRNMIYGGLMRMLG